MAAVAACRRHRAPIVSRGGGTSLAGECTNTAVVIDWSKYCHRLISVDPDARTCIVEPGAVLDLMNDQLRRYQLEFGPEPATHDHCTLGGMIGNNSCGATAQRTGKVVDNVVALEVLLYDGTRMWVGETDDADYREIQRAGGRRAEIYAQLRALRDEHLAALRTAYPHIPRRVSGYNLDSLLPEKGFHVAQALVGTEGTCVVVLRAKLRLVPRVQARTAVFLGYPDIASSADAVPSILRSEPIALEGLDAKLITFQQEKHLNPDALTKLPAGQAYLLVQMGGDTQEEADGAADAMLGLDRQEQGRRRRRVLRRPGAGEADVAGPRVRARGHSTGAGPARHLARLGGLRRRRRRPRRLPARPAEALRRVRLRAGLALRALRPGLRALPHPVRPADRGRHRRLPPLRRTRRRPRGLLRRVVLRRARRRPAARRAAAEDVPDRRSSRRSGGSRRSSTRTTG